MHTYSKTLTHNIYTTNSKKKPINLTKKHEVCIIYIFISTIAMNYKQRCVVILSMLLSWYTVTSANQEIIEFDQYLWYINAFNKYDKNISDRELDIAYQTVSNTKCTWIDNGEYYDINPICFRKKELPELEFTESVDRLRDNVQWFNYVYNTAPAETFDYEWWLPNYKDQTASDFLLIQHTRAHKALATYHTIEQDTIRISKSIVAQIQADKYRFYAVYNDTSMRRWCTLHNYEKALYSMDKVFLYPWQVFNFNNHITDLDYCTWSWRKDLQFYGGVCGAASQLFRSSLIIPFVTVTQRQWHSERWAKYYGDDITGDDAAIYEMYKQLEIQNTGPRWLYFRTIKWEKYSYLVAITPYQPKQAVRITRSRESKLKTNLTKSIYDIQSSQLYPDIIEFSTRYARKNYTTN